MFRNLFVLSIILLTGCSTTQSYKGIYVSNAQIIDSELLAKDVAQLKVHRPSAILQRMASLKIYIDGKQEIVLSNDAAKAIMVKPGKHRIESKMGALDGKSGCGFDFEIISGELIYVTASPSGIGVALPIVSVLANPAVCKFSLTPIESKNIEAIEKINGKI